MFYGGNHNFRKGLRFKGGIHNFRKGLRFKGVIISGRGSRFKGRISHRYRLPKSGSWAGDSKHSGKNTRGKNESASVIRILIRRFRAFQIEHKKKIRISIRNPDPDPTIQNFLESGFRIEHKKKIRIRVRNPDPDPAIQNIPNRTLKRKNMAKNL